MRVGAGELAHLAAACVVLGAGIWSNSGTLAPYAASLRQPLLSEPCGYALNIDHHHFAATYLLLDGAPRERWERSILLRRALYPLLAYPAMKGFGFLAGGLVTNLALACAATVGFWWQLRRRFDRGAARAALWLLATYPGFVYWGGLPYSYAAIVPLSLLCFLLLWRLEDVAGWRQAALVGLAMGVLFTGYDLLPIFGVAGVGLLLARRQLPAAGVLALAQLLPTLVVLWVLRSLLRVPLHNDNSDIYLTILESYLTGGNLVTWWGMVKELPRTVVEVFLFANFALLPLLFVTVLALARWGGERERPLLGRAELWLAVAAGLLLLFNNLAPPYTGWQMRGSWLARLYQPVLPLLVVGVAHGLWVLRGSGRTVCGPAPGATRAHASGAALAAVVLAIAAQAVVVFAPLAGWATLSGELYHRFYGHERQAQYATTLERLGRRPLGWCGFPER